jgi:hypothetical protein
MKAINVVRLSLLIGGCESALGAAPIELRLRPGKAPGSENCSVAESITERGGSRIATNVSDPTLTVYLPDASKSNGAAIVVAPGEAPQALSIDSEGTKVAEWLNSKGIAAFVLKNRLRQQPPGAGRPVAPPRAGQREELKIVKGNATPRQAMRAAGS